MRLIVLLALLHRPLQKIGRQVRQAPAARLVRQAPTVRLRHTHTSSSPRTAVALHMHTVVATAVRTPSTRVTISSIGSL